MTWDVDFDTPRFGLVVPCPTCTPPSPQTLANYDPTVHKTARLAWEAAIAWPTRSWLGLSGTVGCGKTHLLAGMADRLLRRRIPYTVRTGAALWEMITAAWSMTGEHRLSYETELRRMVTSPWPLLVDDLGAGRQIPGAQWDALDAILATRYGPPALPTAWTTNMAWPEFAAQLPRAASRVSEVGVWCSIEAEDYRPRARAPDHR